MKVIHTYVDDHTIIWKELLYVQYLSAILAKKHYGNISFYGDTKVCQQLKILELPYDEINSKLVNKTDVKTFSIPKLKVYKEIREPFVHIDTDTLLFSKIDFQNFEEDYLFSHLDIWMDDKLSRKESVEELYEHYLIQKTVEPVTPKIILDLIKQKHNYQGMHETYSELFFKLLNRIETKLYDKVNFRGIPNMNVVYVNNFKTFSEACRLTLKHYYENKDDIDKHKNGPCYIEQFILHNYLRTIDKKYRQSNKKNNHVIFNEQPLGDINDNGDGFGRASIINQKHLYFNNQALITKLSKYKNWDIMSSAEKYKTLYLKDENSVKELFDSDFGGFLHLTFLKWKPTYQAIVIDKLRQEIGDYGIRKIHKYFETRYINQDDLEPMSDGEKLYSKITGFDFNPKPKSVL